MYVMPPSKAAASGRHRRRSPASRPGVKFNAKSMMPAPIPSRKLSLNSSPVYSNPNINRSMRTPMSAPVRTKLSLTLRGARPPLPRVRPATSYKGIAENPHRFPSLANTARPTTTRPSSMKRNDTSCAVVIGWKFTPTLKVFSTKDKETTGHPISDRPRSSSNTFRAVVHLSDSAFRGAHTFYKRAETDLTCAHGRVPRGRGEAAMCDLILGSPAGSHLYPLLRLVPGRK